MKKEKKYKGWEQFSSLEKSAMFDYGDNDFKQHCEETTDVLVTEDFMFAFDDLIILREAFLKLRITLYLPSLL